VTSESIDTVTDSTVTYPLQYRKDAVLFGPISHSVTHNSSTSHTIGASKQFTVHQGGDHTLTVIAAVKAESWQGVERFSLETSTSDWYVNCDVAGGRH
jgi:hypothetical protein